MNDNHDERQRLIRTLQFAVGIAVVLCILTSILLWKTAAP